MLENSKPILSLTKAVSIMFALAFMYFLAYTMYVPSLPSIQTFFHTTTSTTQLTLSVFLLSAAFAQLLSGPLSDKYGRKPILVISTAIVMIGTIICFFTPDNFIAVFIMARAIQGLGAGVLFCICRVILLDVATKEQIIKTMSWVSMIFFILPGASPILGGWLQDTFDWHASFIVMLGYATFIFILITRSVPETNLNKNIHATDPATLKENYKVILSNKVFWALAVGVVMGIVAPIAFEIVGAFVYINQFGISAKSFGILGTSLTIFPVLSRLASLLLGKYINIINQIVIGFAIMFLSATAMTIYALFFDINPIVIAIFIGISYSSTGITLPLCAGLALTIFPERRGIAASLYGGLQMILSFITTIAIVSFKPTMIVMCIFILLASTIGMFICVPQIIRYKS